MELVLTTLLCIFLSSIFLSIHLVFNKSKTASSPALPPGRTGWPVIGETLAYLSAGWKGHPEKFVFDRMSKHSSTIFRTNLFGENFAVLCGAAGNKFLFSSENKLVRGWWPKTMDKIYPNSSAASAEEAIKMKKILAAVLKAEPLHRYIPVMDQIARRHFADEWQDKEQVTVFPLAKDYTLRIGCRLLIGLEDPDELCKFRLKLNRVIAGIFSAPIDLPGTPFRKAIKAAESIRKEFVAVIRRRKIELEEGKASPVQDILTHMLVSSGNESRTSSSINNELEIAEKIMALLVAGHDTTSSACAFVVKYLAELPHVYDIVYKEQREIKKSKGDGELLNWEDLQKMKYSWNVACEVLRLSPPFQGTFREAITDIVYHGFSIPKGWKLSWNIYSTHKNPECFQEPEKFDETRFKGSGPAPYTFVPFGGGPRMCPGKELARLEILVFMHHIVNTFKWKKLIENEKIVVNPIAVPAKGLPINLYPHPIHYY